MIFIQVTYCLREQVGKWIFPTGNLETLKQTVVNLIDSQNEKVKIHPAHGESSTIGNEKKYNQFYLMWKNELNKLMPN